MGKVDDKALVHAAKAQRLKFLAQLVQGHQHGLGAAALHVDDLVAPARLDVQNLVDRERAHAVGHLDRDHAIRLAGFPGFDKGRHGSSHILGKVALAHKRQRAQGQRLKHAVLGVRDKDNLGLGARLAKGPRKGDSVDSGHLDVQKKQVKTHVVQAPGQRVCAVERLYLHLGTQAAQVMLGCLRDRRRGKGLVVTDGNVKLKHAILPNYSPCKESITLAVNTPLANEKSATPSYFSAIFVMIAVP